MLRRFSQRMRQRSCARRSMRLPPSTHPTRARRWCAITRRPKTFITLWNSNSSERIGSLGLKLHTGRSRNEQIATDLRLYVRSQIDLVVEALAAWASALVEKAHAAGDAVMPSYTHMQRAEPVLVAHWLLAYVEMALRDAGAPARLRGAAQLLPAGFRRGSRRNAGAGPRRLPRASWVSPGPPPTRSTPPATAISFWSICKRSHSSACI